MEIVTKTATLYLNQPMKRQDSTIYLEEPATQVLWKYTRDYACFKMEGLFRYNFMIIKIHVAYLC